MNWRSALRIGRRECGATTVEYALVAMLIALVLVASVTVIGTNLSSFFADAATKV